MNFNPSFSFKLIFKLNITIKSQNATILLKKKNTKKSSHLYKFIWNLLQYHNERMFFLYIYIIKIKSHSKKKYNNFVFNNNNNNNVIYNNGFHIFILKKERKKKEKGMDLCKTTI